MLKQYRGGTIHTMGESGTCDTIIVDDTSGRIMAIGRDCEAIQADEIIELNGRCVVPGFCDSHLHVVSLGQAMKMVDLSQTKSIAEALELLNDKKRTDQPDIIRGHGWNQDSWQEGRFPTCEDLDLVAMDRPVIITRVCGHIMCTNSFVVKALGIKNGDKVDGGAYGFLESGRPNGLFFENARKQIYGYIPPQSTQQLMESILLAQEQLVSRGICSVHANDVRYGIEPHYENVWLAYQTLEAEGKLKMRFYHQNLVYTLEGMKELLQKGLRTGEGTEWSKQGPYKVMLDGSLGGRTAYLNQPYKDDPTTQGILCFSESELTAFFALAEAEQQQFIIHAIGDGAMDLLFKAYENSNPNKGNPLRHGIVHCQITSPALLNKFEQHQIHAYIQPIFLDYDMMVVNERVGESLASSSYNWRFFYDHAVNAPMSSDAPIETTDVLKGIYSAVSRKRLDQTPVEGFNPAFKLTPIEALYGYTVAAAVASFDEKIKGKLEAGYLADMTILDQDLLTCEEAEILNAQIIATIVGGRLVYGEIV